MAEPIIWKGKTYSEGDELPEDLKSALAQQPKVKPKKESETKGGDK